MATEIRLPDLGEGVADVTINRWRVAVGDAVNAGDVLLEVATDKVDTEIQAPASGVLLKINFRDGELAPVSAVMGYIGQAGESVGDRPAVAEAPAAPASASTTAKSATAASTTAASTTAESASVKASPVAKRVAADKGVDLASVAGTGPGGQITKQDVLAATAAPAIPAALPGDLADEASLAVRRAAAEHNINLREIAGDRPLSTLTVYDVLSAAASRAAGKSVRIEPAFVRGKERGVRSETAAPAPVQPAAPPPAVAPAAATPVAAAPKPAAAPAPTQLKPGEELVKLSRMRAAVARNTAQSLFSAPHVTTMWDVDMSAVLQHRAAHKKEFAAAGVNLTITAYFVEAIVAGLKAVPAANATWTDDGVIIKRVYNIGMATALPMDPYGIGGLIVPVIKNAGDLNLMGIARAVNELADRARKNELKQEDLADGTFTLSNYGTSGSRFQTPIIVQPQVGILGVGAVEKRAVVVSNGHPLEPNLGDYLTFKPMTTLGFSYDHRVLDGATADAFCAAVKKHLEGYAA
ncbi:MAG TPA: 2-oxo acid dehydrogenase subunit E2 [Chloroflexi bacterium]|nr:2-oxo acid dehydrogenase subunit E2 [Chloroflexota bacterium]HHW85048.1 2-oxo acid dehydrogenase subunit E2 [Chloroflexota bacterium]